MERIGFLINKLKEQYEKADSNEGMLITLQMLYRELLPKMFGSPAIGNVSVMVPGQMDLSFLEQNLEQKNSLDLASNKNGKQVFELSAASAEILKPVITPPLLEEKPIDKPSISVVEPAKNPFITTTQKVELTAVKPETVKEKVEEKPKTEEPIHYNNAGIFEAINSRFMPQETVPRHDPPINIKPNVETLPTTIPTLPPEIKVTETVALPKEVHETIQNNAQPSLNDKAEKRQPELFHVLKTEPLKDLKKAISINERFQYINHLFMKDETMYDRSLKTINSFNVLSEAQFWIRKELAIKMGWDDNDEVVEQFMQLIERRFL